MSQCLGVSSSENPYNLPHHGRGGLITPACILLVAFACPARAQVDVSGEWGAIFHEDLPHRGAMRLGDCDWLTVLTVVEDPTYLDQPFITSTHFKREADTSKRSPSPCH